MNAFETADKNGRAEELRQELETLFTAQNKTTSNSATSIPAIKATPRSEIDPGDDVVVDWGAGRMFRLSDHPVDVGVSGFGLWQLTRQAGGPAGIDEERYRLFGIGPEASLSIFEPLTVRVRAHWEFAARREPVEPFADHMVERRPLVAPRRFDRCADVRFDSGASDRDR